MAQSAPQDANLGAAVAKESANLLEKTKTKRATAKQKPPTGTLNRNITQAQVTPSRPRRTYSYSLSGEDTDSNPASTNDEPKQQPKGQKKKKGAATAGLAAIVQGHDQEVASGNLAQPAVEERVQDKPKERPSGHKPVGRKSNSEEGIIQLPDESEDEENQFDPFFGQKRSLRRVFSNLRAFQCHEKRRSYYKKLDRQKKELKPIKEICDACRQCVTALSSVDDTVENSDSSAELTLTTTITTLNRLLKNINPDDQAPTERAKYAMQVYVYVFTSLVILLEAAVRYYSVLTKGQNRDATTESEARRIVDILDVINRLDLRSKEWKWEKDVNDAPVVKEMRGKVLVPVKGLLEVFSRERVRLRDEREQYHELLRTQQMHDDRMIREDLAWEEKMRVNRMKDRLRHLFIERKNAEPKVSRWRKHCMNAVVRDATQVRLLEEDANGRPFQRVALFRQRYHLPCIKEPWKDEEEKALIEGLSECFGKYSPCSLRCRLSLHCARVCADVLC